MDLHAELVLDARCELGEGPVWHDDTLAWCDIDRHTLHRWEPATGERRSWELDETVSASAPASDGRWLVALHQRMALLDLNSGRVTDVCQLAGEPVGNRCNDGKCDPAGRFWIGTISKPRQPDAALYRVERDGRCTRVLPGAINSNGLAWPADGRRLYYIDTGTRRIDVLDFDPRQGTIANRRTLVDLADQPGKPDGMTIDRQGRLWVALHGAGQVLGVDPLARTIIQRIHVPASRVTSCTFGGPGLDELFITTARGQLSPEQLAAQPHAGGVFRARPGVGGMPVDVYQNIL